MLIARIKPPRLPQDLDLLIIRRQGDNLDRHVDYLCRRHIVHDALLYKIENDPNYADLQRPDERAVLAPPVHGSVAHMLPVCTEPTDTPPSTTALLGPTEAANALPGQANDDDGNERYVGGVLNVAPSPTAETEHVRRGVHEILQRPLHNNQNIIDAPVPDWLVCRKK
jgi:hypothetical protein